MDTLIDILVLLAAVLVVVPVAERVRMGGVAAYLAIGLTLGPSGVGLITDDREIRALAELGVVFLLFSVGLEITVERLRLFGRKVYGLAASQMVLTTVVLALGGLLWGLPSDAAMLLGGALSISSTAVVLQLMSERGALGGPLGRTVIAIVLLQDLAVPLMLVVVKAAEGGGFTPSLLTSIAVFAAFILAMFVAERRLLRRLLRWTAEAQSPEVFTAAALLLVLGVGWLAELVGLTMTLGAFLAGMLVADTEFRHQVAADIEPFRGMLLGLFFVTVGIGIDLGFAAARWTEVLALTAGLMLAKCVVLALLGLAFRLPWRRACALGALLSQGSEFAFVLLALGVTFGVVPGDAAKLLTVAVGLTMILTPLGTSLFERLVPTALSGRRPVLGNLDKDVAGAAGHVVIAGFGQVGMAVARHLAGQRIPIVALDLTPRRVAASRSRGLPVFYGNATRLDVLRGARLDRAAALVVTLPEPEVVEQITLLARRAFPTLKIFARTPDEDWIDRLRKAGANAVVLEGLSTAYDFAERVMLVYEPQQRGGD